MISTEKYHEAIATIKQYQVEQLELLKEEKAKAAVCDIPKERWGVHSSHCCFEHGCKYGDADCPVENGLIDQEFPCDYCQEDEENGYIYLRKYQ